MPQHIREITGLVSKEVRVNYVVTLPEFYNPREQYPLIVYLHGAGENGMPLNRAKYFCISQQMPREYKSRFICMMPVCPEGSAWRPDSVYHGINNVCKEFPVDIDRICISGYSMGGRGVWDIACEYPNVFAALAPFAGYSCYLNASKIAHVPSWTFHGEKDTVVPIDESRKMVGAIRESGGNPRFSVFPSLGHSGWEKVYVDSFLYDWFLIQKRKPR